MGGRVFARNTKFKMKPGLRESALTKVEELESQVLGLPGIEHFTCAMKDDGSG